MQYERAQIENSNYVRTESVGVSPKSTASPSLIRVLSQYGPIAHQSSLQELVVIGTIALYHIRIWREEERKCQSEQLKATKILIDSFLSFGTIVETIATHVHTSN